MDISKYAGWTLVAAFAEATMLAYTWVVPDIYIDYAITSCYAKGDGKAQIIGIGKDGETYRQRRFKTTTEETNANGITCSDSPLPQLNEQSMSCTLQTRGQYIPLINIWPYVSEEGAECYAITPEQLKDIQGAMDRKKVSKDFVFRMMR